MLLVFKQTIKRKHIVGQVHMWHTFIFEVKRFLESISGIHKINMILYAWEKKMTKKIMLLLVST